MGPNGGAIEEAGSYQVREGLLFAVAVRSLAEFGRKEIRLAEHEMPGLMALRREYVEVHPLRAPGCWPRCT